MKKVVAGVMMAAACACGAAQQETILVAADPFAVGLKKAVVQHLEKRGFAVKDYGATDANKDKPYFESAVEVCKALQNGEAKRAMLFCGTGMGMNMIANRFKGVRAAVVESVFAAKMCRTINDANVLCMGGRVIGPGLACEIVDAFLGNSFEGGRHQRRVDQITAIENE